MTDVTEYAVARAIGAKRERERIIDELQHHGRSLVFGNDIALLNNIIKLIEGDTE